MKVFVILALVAACNATFLGHSTGSSVSTRAEDGLGNYKFGYDEQHASGGSSRQEVGNPWGVSGSYSLNVADGRKRVVKYVADGLGFRASVHTNEPGTAPEPAAATSISAPVPVKAHVGVAPAFAHGAYLHGGLAHGGLVHGGLAHGGLLHGGLAHGGLVHGGLVYGGLVHGGLAHGGLIKSGLGHAGLLHGGLYHGGLHHGGVGVGGVLHGGLLGAAYKTAIHHHGW